MEGIFFSKAEEEIALEHRVWAFLAAFVALRGNLLPRAISKGQSGLQNGVCEQKALLRDNL